MLIRKYLLIFLIYYLFCQLCCLRSVSILYLYIKIVCFTEQIEIILYSIFSSHFARTCVLFSIKILLFIKFTLRNRPILCIHENRKDDAYVTGRPMVRLRSVDRASAHHLYRSCLRRCCCASVVCQTLG